MTDHTVPPNNDDQQPQPIELVAWEAPRWATETRADGAEVRYSRPTERVPVLPEFLDQPGGHIAAEAYQIDAFEVRDGVVSVVRDPEPVVIIEGFRLTLAAAHNLGKNLVDLVETIEAIAGLDVTR